MARSKELPPHLDQWLTFHVLMSRLCAQPELFDAVLDCGQAVIALDETRERIERLFEQEDAR